jgi:DNA-binding NtrC family response regulator
MPGMDGHEFPERAIKADPGAHVMLMAGDYTLESALEAIRRGGFFAGDAQAGSE